LFCSEGLLLALFVCTISEDMAADSSFADSTACHGKCRSNILSEKKSASWKVMIAYYMKKNTLVSNAWLGEHLYMGRPQGVSQYVSDFGKSKGFETLQYKKMTGRINT